ncbi:MAG TPA: YdcF family protein [Chryseolinea sp.]|nr:YdcF family protein [Chryseolinea sp.]
MKNLYIIALFTILSFNAAAQGYDKNYRRVSSGDLTVDKNFYLLTVIDKAPDVKSILSGNATLKTFLQKKTGILKAHVTDTCSYPVNLVNDFIWKDDTTALAKELFLVYNANKKAFDKMIDGHLRPSGYYQRFAGMTNSALLAKAWNQCFYGMDYIINQFGLGKRMRYPHIDSVSYVVTSRSYRIVLKDIMASLDEVSTSFDVFYKPSLAVAMQLMQANDRNEPARLEPLEEGINKAAFEQVKKTDWKKYRYAAIVLPGNGPTVSTTPVSPDGKIHCDAAARRYLAGDAPFIIPTGGYCYPFQGPYNEAVEMKKYLMDKYNIPASAIIAEPQARHTTTNIRNSVRLMIRYGIPTDGPSLFVTSMSQTKYSAADSFDARNKRELGYTPYTRKKQLTNHVIEFYPVMECLHMDPYDPLDP